MSSSSSSPYASVMGVPTFYHIHLKRALPAICIIGVYYDISLTLTNEMDMFMPDQIEVRTNEQKKERERERRGKLGF